MPRETLAESLRRKGREKAAAASSSSGAAAPAPPAAVPVVGNLPGARAFGSGTSRTRSSDNDVYDRRCFHSAHQRESAAAFSSSLSSASLVPRGTSTGSLRASRGGLPSLKGGGGGGGGGSFLPRVEGARPSEVDADHKITRREEADRGHGRSGAVMGGSAQAKVMRGGAMMQSFGGQCNSGRLGGGMEVEVYAGPEAAIKEPGRHAGRTQKNPGHGQFRSSQRGDIDNGAGGSSEYSAGRDALWREGGSSEYSAGRDALWREGGSSEYSAGRDALWREGTLRKAERDHQGAYLLAAGDDDLESTDAGGFERGMQSWLVGGEGIGNVEFEDMEGEGEGKEGKEGSGEEEEEEEEVDEVGRETRAFLAEMMTRFDAGSVFERSEAGRKRMQQGREALAAFGMLLESPVADDDPSLLASPPKIKPENGKPPGAVLRKGGIKARDHHPAAPGMLQPTLKGRNQGT